MVNQLKAGALLNYVVIVLNILVGLLYTPYMLRMMGQSEYGLYALVASVISYLTVLDLGLGNAVVRYTAKFRAEAKLKEQYNMFGMFLLIYIILGVIGLVIGGGLYLNVDNMFGDSMTLEELNHARTMMLILVFNLAFTLPMSIFGSIITAYERFVFQKVINIVRTLLNTFVMVALLSFGYKAVAMVVIHTIFNVLTLIINYVYCKKKLHVEIHFGRFEWGFLKEVAIYSFWIFLNVIMDRLYWSTGQFVLGAISGTIAVSIFAIAIQFQQMYMMFSTAISSVFLPKVVSIVSKNDSRKEISDLFIRTGRIQNIVMIFILCGFVTFGKQFISLWAGNEYLDAYYMTTAFFIALYIPLIQNLGITILQARNKMKFRSLLYICIAIVAFILEIIFARYWNGTGCAIAISLALILGQGLIMNIYYHLKQNLDTIKFWKEIVKMDFVPICLTFCFSYFYKNYIDMNSWVTLIIGIVCFVIIYIPLCAIFSMNTSERRILLKPLLILTKQ